MNNDDDLHGQFFFIFANLYFVCFSNFCLIGKHMLKNKTASTTIMQTCAIW